MPGAPAALLRGVRRAVRDLWSSHTAAEIHAARPDADPEESEGACCAEAANIDAEARARREILGAALTGAGLVNYPTEGWRWSYGDRYWALSSGAEAALYGPCDEDARGPHGSSDAVSG